ncbi:Ferroportin1-domain-containing protein [Xylaria bambusicola]|uniref:Ferroportin1-domain-containing protein n=1 Tax=Xylaria bambusicola TaxID=326684 RepID=UPI002007F406|nr:Ferroportin1-domain-containing protein [Xylaria bambusicola]KAI0506851.1 Ferroportin1-domain-containing protein [Xylaria bambusicola]
MASSRSSSNEFHDETVLLGDNRDDALPPPRPGLTRAQAFNLYLSHALSTWNARGYEFAAILFTAAAYPDTLVAAALRMIIIYIAMILFSSSVGQWVERSPNRLRTLLSTIICNRASVILGSFVWLLILSQENLVTGGDSLAATPPRFALPRNDALKGIVFAVAVAFGIIERLSASGNLISMERDWVVTIAGQAGHPYDLTNLNAVMRRIDLVCKLMSPILISIVISATGSVRVGVLYTGLGSLVSIPIELLSAKGVWNGSIVLQEPKPVPIPRPPIATSGESRFRITSWLSGLRNYLQGLEMYFSSSVWMPSFALAMLHFNMLTWRATFITYLINIGYSLNTITVARAIGSVFEISSTVITPRGIVYLGKTSRHRTASGDESNISLMHEETQQEDSVDDAQTIIGLQRLGLWGMSSQLLNTIPVVLALWVTSSQRNEATTDDIPTLLPRLTGGFSIGWSLILFTFLAFSRLGVWVFDLTTQQLTQTLVPKTQRSSFAGVENSVVNVFEVLGAGAAIAFPRVEQYRWLAVASLVGVVLSWCLYAWWVRAQRGHLVHWEKLGTRR